jgi:murein DD-endopeptidase MepM/ murein hydrolase activator NlpD
MGDLRAGTGGTDATQPTGRRVARHSAEQVSDQPYVGRRVAARPTSAAPSLVVQPVPGRRRAGTGSFPVAPPSPFAEAPAPGRRALRVDVVPFAMNPAFVAPAEPEPLLVEAPAADCAAVETAVLAAPVLAAPALPVPVLPAPALADADDETVAEDLPVLEAPVAEAPIAVPASFTLAPIALTTLAASPVGTEPVEDKPVSQQPITHESVPQLGVAPRRTTTGRRAARRRSPLPLPGAPLLMGVAILAVSAGGALQAMQPSTADAASAHHIAPASALSGSSAVGTASLLGGRPATVSRSSDRLQAAADAQAKQRAEALSGFASQAQKQAQKIKLHSWVLPVAVGVYHLTARFGDSSSLWSNFHTGLDFASPTGTPIMAVAGGTITETGYSGAYGNRTIETLADGTELWYCHQNEFGISVGATVQPGQVIGYVGSTGNVTGPHLHLEVHPGGGDPVDPYTALEVHGLRP